MRRLIFDTNVCIDWINAGRHEAVLFQRDVVRHLSAVVVMELYAGAATRRDRRVVDRFVAPFRRAGRLIVPSASVYEEAGAVLRILVESRRLAPAKAGSLSPDVLIALSARSIGATVVTGNARDFEAIRAVRSFGLLTV